MGKNNDDNTGGPFVDPFAKNTGAAQFFKHTQLVSAAVKKRGKLAV